MILERPRLVSRLNRGSFVLGLAAAGFWWWSASIHLPAPKAYFDQAPDNDPFFVAIKLSSNLNAIAAILTGLSLALTALSGWIGNLQRWPPRWVEKI